MSELLKNSIEYIEQAKAALLITVGENSAPYIRTIGAYANDGANIYFLTARATEKVKHLKSNPIVTFYFQNEGQSYQSFKSVAVTGEAEEVLEGGELDRAIDAISIRYPILKEKVKNGEFKNSTIYKVKAKFVKLADYTQSPREVIENL